MNYRTLGRTGWQVSEISLGAWAFGGDWGTRNDDESRAALNAALDAGVNLVDTADVYGDGHSERVVAQVRKARGDQFYVATKIGRRLDPLIADGFTRENLTRFVERSLRNLDTDCLDLVQLHCPPTEVYYRPEIFGILDDLVQAGKIQYYGVSVEKVEEALKAIEYPNLATVQIIFNMFRQRPAELFFTIAQERQVGILTRVPLVSGLLTGKFTTSSMFAQNDHRQYNRQGEEFDRGETFAGVNFETGLKAVAELEKLKPENMSMAQFALRWILMFDAVTCAIPGAKRPSQVQENVQASALPELDAQTMSAIKTIYDQYIRDQVHHRW